MTQTFSIYKWKGTSKFMFKQKQVLQYSITLQIYKAAKQIVFFNDFKCPSLLSDNIDMNSFLDCVDINFIVVIHYTLWMCFALIQHFIEFVITSHQSNKTLGQSKFHFLFIFFFFAIEGYSHRGDLTTTGW
jgi:hypothetical protein